MTSSPTLTAHTPPATLGDDAAHSAPSNLLHAPPPSPPPQSTAPQLTSQIAQFKTNERYAGRRTSVQFLSHANKGLPTGSPKPGRSGAQRRMSSPPPPPVFRQRVSFDTFDRPADFIEENSFTLICKHKDYEYTKRSRTFLCGLDSNDYSEFALEWLIDELVDDGDEIVCLRVVEKDSSLAADPSVEAGRYRKEAIELMRHIQHKNHEGKAINLILEFSVGKVNKVIDDMINLYEPAILVVGTRGRRLDGFQGLLPGSVSKYCLQHSPVPVIVVRPNSKRAKSKRKRNADPSRHGYRDILDRSGPEGGHLLDVSNRGSLVDIAQPATEAEAAAVAAAIGYKELNPAMDLLTVDKPEDGPLSPDSIYTLAREDSPEDLRSPGVVMKSPELQNLDSPVISSQSSDEDEEDEDDDDDDDDDARGGVSTTVADALGTVVGPVENTAMVPSAAAEKELPQENGATTDAERKDKHPHPPGEDTGVSTAVDVAETGAEGQHLTHHNHDHQQQKREDAEAEKPAQ